MNQFDFKNRTAVVTGGAQGFGLDIAKRFLDSGAKVFIWDIDEKLLKSTVEELKNSSEPNIEITQNQEDESPVSLDELSDAESATTEVNPEDADPTNT